MQHTDSSTACVPSCVLTPRTVLHHVPLCMRLYSATTTQMCKSVREGPIIQSSECHQYRIHSSLITPLCTVQHWKQGSALHKCCLHIRRATCTMTRMMGEDATFAATGVVQQNTRSAICSHQQQSLCLLVQLVNSISSTIFRMLE